MKPWLAGALRASGQLEVGAGNGPVHHFHHLHARPLAAGRIRCAPAAGRRPPDLEAIYGLEFIRAWPPARWRSSEFAYYLAQDAIYLNGYSRVLARASALAPTEAEQLFWARSAQQCLEVESELHRTWLSTRTVEPAWARHQVLRGPPAGRLSLRQLRSAGGGRPAVLLAVRRGRADAPRAVPRGRRPGGAPLRRVAADVRGRGFRAATREAIALADDAGRRPPETSGQPWLTAFRQSCRFEVEFFDAPRLHS